MAKQKTVYVCGECGREFPKWSGKCPECGSWNTLEEVVTDTSVKSSSSRTVKYSKLSEIGYDEDVRYDTGSEELNRVLGGGLVKGSLVLLSGDPGIGKSTLLLQICSFLGRERQVLYVSGEESRRQIKLRAERLNVESDNLSLIADTDCNAIIGAIRQNKPDIVIVDSIQTVQLDNISSSAGSLVQVRECTNAFMRLAKTEEIPVFIVGHVNKDGGIAGPKVLEHIVDTVLYFEGDKQLSYRILRAEKNRFGSTNEIGVFAMSDSGLQEVQNPSAMLLSGRPANVSGISILCTMEGSRPILAEVQALVTKTSFSSPRRVSNGFDYNRLCLILAVLEKRTGFMFGMFDIYINIIGGLRIEEPAADLAVAAALYSGLCDRPLPDDLFVLGEIGLGGEIRNCSHVSERIREGERLGFKACIVPKAALQSLDRSKKYRINIMGVSNLGQVFKAIDLYEQKKAAKEKSATDAEGE
ncbi:MAG TPA: DNA repair protein RadA [Ruminococcaceae bacterium]|nr:DNA repair protein RadA [Oscillospiraceae bacterium]